MMAMGIARPVDYLSWIQIGMDILGANAEDLAGLSVSLSSDGDVVAVGSPLMMIMVTPQDMFEYSP